MMIIILTVVTQGTRVDSEYKGSLRGLLFVNSGFFQAVGVISFGKLVVFQSLRTDHLKPLSAITILF